MSGRIDVPANKYTSVDETLQYSADAKQTIPFPVNRLLDFLRNDGPGRAVISLDEGTEIFMDVGDFLGPWENFTCLTLYGRCIEQGKTARLRGLGI